MEVTPLERDAVECRGVRFDRCIVIGQKQLSLDTMESSHIYYPIGEY